MGVELLDLAAIVVTGEAIIGLGVVTVMPLPPHRVGATLTAVATMGRLVAIVTTAVL